MPSPTALLAEGEHSMRRDLRARLDRLWPALHICAEASNGHETICLIERCRPDVVFLDIEMSDMDGLDVTRQASCQSHVACISAIDKHAVAAFEQGAIDYVLKPYDDIRLGLTVERVKQRLGSAWANLEIPLRQLARARQDYLQWIRAQAGNEVRLISVDEVCYFQASLGYTRVFTASNEFLIHTSLKELIAQLDPTYFWMIHRSTIVNARAISGTARDLRNRLWVKLKLLTDKLAVSEANERLFRPM
jgi:DNA-binding LytR/AlgR family response regulator